MGLLTAGLSLAAGLIGAKSNRDSASASKSIAREQMRNDREMQERSIAAAGEQQRALLEASKVDLAKMREEAEANGFNPLTILGATGGSGFAGVPAGGGGAPMGAGAGYSRSIPALGSASFVSDALSIGLDMWSNLKGQEEQKEVDALRTEMMKEELKDLKRRNEAPLQPDFGYSIPQVVTTTREITNATPALAPVSPGMTTMLEGTTPTVSNASHVNAGTYVDPRSPDAEMGETRYGDIAQEISGGVNVVRDLVYDRRMQKIVKEHGRSVADKIHKDYATDKRLSLDDAIKRHTPPKLAMPKRPYTPTPNRNPLNDLPAEKEGWW